MKKDYNLLNNFLNAFRSFFLIVSALILRDTRVTFGRSSLGYLWAILNPAIGVAVFVTIFSLVNRQPPFGQSLALFFATGFLIYNFYNKLSSDLMNCIRDNRGLLLYPPVSYLHAIVSKFILIASTYFIIIIIFFTCLIKLELADLPAFYSKTLDALLLVCLLGLSVGLFNLCVANYFPSWRQIFALIKRPSFLLSGIFFIPSNLPENILSFLKWNPILHTIEAFRSAYYPNYESRILDYSFVIHFSLILILFSFMGIRLNQKLVK